MPWTLILFSNHWPTTKRRFKDLDMTSDKLEAAFRKWFTTHYPEPDEDAEKEVVDSWCYKFDIARTAFIAGYGTYI